MSETVFSIARDFSPNPGPRFIRQGAHSGEALRRQLVKKLRSIGGKLRIDLDGTKGMGSSFLDEAFGGLVRSDGMDSAQLLQRLDLRSNAEPSYIAEIRDSIRRAVPAHA